MLVGGVRQTTERYHLRSTKKHIPTVINCSQGLETIAYVYRERDIYIDESRQEEYIS